MCLLQGPTYPRRRVLKPLFKVLAAEARCQVVQRRGSDEVALRGSEGERVWHSYYGVPHICKSMARCPYAMHAHHSCCDTMPHLPATGSRATWPMAASPCWQCRSAIGGWGRLPACRNSHAVLKPYWSLLVRTAVQSAHLSHLAHQTLKHCRPLRLCRRSLLGVGG